MDYGLWITNAFAEVLIFHHSIVLILLQIEVSTIMSQAGATLSGLVSRTQDLVSKLKALHFDRHEFVCLKYLVLFNPGELSLQVTLFHLLVYKKIPYIQTHSL